MYTPIKDWPNNFEQLAASLRNTRIPTEEAEAFAKKLADHVAPKETPGEEDGSVVLVSNFSKEEMQALVSIFKGRVCDSGSLEASPPLSL